MKKPVIHTVPLGSISQAFHPKYLRVGGKVQKPYMDFAQKAHRELCCLQRPQTYESDEIWDALKPYKRARILGIQKALRGLENGMFTFCCEEIQCKEHPDNPDKNGECDACLATEKTEARPEAHNCTGYRKEHHCGDVPVRVLKLATTMR